MGLTSAAGAGDAAPAIDAVRSVLDSDEVTTIVTDAVILSVIRGLERDARPPSEAMPSLTGTWSGQLSPVVLALAHRQPPS